MSKLVWYLKQLLPLTYRSLYVCGEEHQFCVWKMWLGKCYNIKSYSTNGNIPVRDIEAKRMSKQSDNLSKVRVKLLNKFYNV